MSYIQVGNLLIPHYYNGDVLVGGTVNFYEAGTSTPLTVYSDNMGGGGATSRTFTSAGIVVAYVLDTAPAMRQVIKDSSGNTIFDYDNLIFDTTGDLSAYLPLAGGTMAGDLNMGSNDIVAGGDITVGSNKHFIADFGGTLASVHPDDALFISKTSGNVSIRGGATLGVYDDNTLALSISTADVIATGDLTVSGISGNADELVTLSSAGKLLASGTTLTTVNNTLSSLQSQITSNDSQLSGLVSISGNHETRISQNETDIAQNASDISGVAADVAALTFLDLTDTPSSYTASNFLKVNSGGTAIEHQTAAQVALSIQSSVDHGSIGGLSDDDHSQYHNDTRGDARYPLKSSLTTQGDIWYASLASTPSRLGIGTAGQVLTVAGGVPVWSTPSTGVTDHGALTGLSDNDHPQYALIASANTFTANQTIDKADPRLIIDDDGAADGGALYFYSGGVEKASLTRVLTEDYMRATSQNATIGLSLVSKRIINCSDPSSAQDAATKNYVDTTVNALIGSSSGRINFGAFVLAFADGAAVSAEGSQVINFPATFSAIHTVMVTTLYPSGDANTNAHFQLVSYTTSSATVYCQNDAGGFSAAVTPKILVLGTI